MDLLGSSNLRIIAGADALDDPRDHAMLNFGNARSVSGRETLGVRTTDVVSHVARFREDFVSDRSPGAIMPHGFTP